MRQIEEQKVLGDERSQAFLADERSQAFLADLFPKAQELRVLDLAVYRVTH